jgi:hypothetical protein
MVVLLRPFACEPVRDWMAEFKRLRTVSEEPAEQNVCKEPELTVRITRTKTRAMSKAAAAAAAVTGQDVAANCTGLPKNDRQVGGISTEVSKNVSQ